MSDFKKQFFLVLLILCAGLFAASNAIAQTWTATYSNAQNPCQATTAANNVGDPGRCMCNSDYTLGVANAGNCSYDGWVVGCWNPGTGKCQECGTGGTIILGGTACFNNGQYNQGGGGAAMGISCTIQGGFGATTSSSQCIGSGTTTGGFSTN